MASVEITGLKKNFGAVEVIHGVDLQIEDGEFVALVGPSGCGKSTLLRIISGLEPASGGEIRIDGTVVNHLNPRERNIAMVFQNYALYPHMSVAKNMGFNLKLSGMKRGEIDEKVKEVAGLLELDKLLDRKPGQLSGGQRQRVAMGRAIVRDPEVFLFDEPLSNLDAKLRGQMRAEIKRLHQRLQNTIIYVTHDQVEAMTLADRIVIMRDGKIEQQGTPDAIFHDPDTVFVAGFMGSPPMNLVDCMVTPTGLKLGDSEIACATPDGLRAGARVICGIRPDDIRPAADQPGRATATVPVDLIEQLGTEKLVHFRAGQHSMIGKTGGRVDLAEGAPHPLAFDMAHAYFFDPETERRIR